MQLYSWSSGGPVGPEMLVPTWLAWNPSVTALAMGYPHAIVLCRTQPNVSIIATLPIQVPHVPFICAQWQSHTFRSLAALASWLPPTLTRIWIAATSRLMYIGCLVQNSASGIWHQNLLLTASLLEVHGVFVAADPASKAHFIEVRSIRTGNAWWASGVTCALDGDRGCLPLH